MNLVEKVIGQQILYYPIDMATTNFHPIIWRGNRRKLICRQFAYMLLVEFTRYETLLNIWKVLVLDKTWEINVHFPRKDV